MNETRLSETERLQWSLFLLRAGVFIVMFMWTLDKFVNPGHAAAIFESFYMISGMGGIILYTIAAVEMVLILAFLAGLWKTWTYGAVMVLHGISTLSSWNQYLNAFDNLLFFAAWPMLAACIALFLLRDSDTRWTLGKQD
ncbi:MAG: hypothetical protein ACQETO_11850 [Pseudomonadota bacterium]